MNEGMECNNVVSNVIFVAVFTCSKVNITKKYCSREGKEENLFVHTPNGTAKNVVYHIVLR